MFTTHPFAPAAIAARRSGEREFQRLRKAMGGRRGHGNDFMAYATAADGAHGGYLRPMVR